MKSVNTSTKRLTRTSDEDEDLPFEFHITGTIRPGDDDRHPRYQITDVMVSPTDEEDPDHDVDGEEEEDEPVARLNKLLRKKNGDTERSVVRKKRRQDDDQDDENDEVTESRGRYDTDPSLDDTEDLPDDESDEDDDDGDETIMSCIQKSMVSRRR
jgi:hypothetical protein